MRPIWLVIWHHPDGSSHVEAVFDSGPVAREFAKRRTIASDLHPLEYLSVDEHIENQAEWPRGRAA